MWGEAGRNEAVSLSGLLQEGAEEGSSGCQPLHSFAKYSVLSAWLSSCPVGSNALHSHSRLLLSLCALCTSPVFQRVFSPTRAGWRGISSRTASVQEVSSLNGTLVSLLFWLDTALGAMHSAACCWYVSNAGMR